MASVVRTYYSWEVATTSDRSYTTVIMGLWTWAELSIGMLISCAPVLPKFVHHFSPKIVKYLNPSSKSSEPRTGSCTPSAHSEPKVRGPSGKTMLFSPRSDGRATPEISAELYDFKSLSKDGYLTLNDNIQTSIDDEADKSPTKRADLQGGHWSV